MRLTIVHGCGALTLALMSWWNTEGTQHQDIRYTSSDDGARWQAMARQSQ